MPGLDLDDLPSSTPPRRTARDGLLARRRRRQRRAVVVLLVCLVAVGGAAWLVGGQLRTLVASATEPTDFTGDGTGTVQVQVASGSTGRAIGQVLADAGVIKTPGAFLAAADDDPRAASIQPGTYELRSGMSAAAAIDLLLDPAARESLKVVVPEGYTAARTYEALSAVTGTPVATYEAAAKDPALGLPADAQGQVEGYLFPATYDFDPSTTPVQQLAAMVTRATQAMDAAGLPADAAARHAALTEASLVQAEAGSTEDMGKVATVIDNRLAQQMPLQFDTTVNYANGTTALTTTDAERANPSPYNTYLHPGLPPGPISNPGEDAMRATVAPTPGPWLFFVVVDPSTGDTVFSETAAEHQQAVLRFQAWLRANPQG